jgi:hypothetical protein
MTGCAFSEMVASEYVRNIHQKRRMNMHDCIRKILPSQVHIDGSHPKESRDERRQAIAVDNLSLLGPLQHAVNVDSYQRDTPADLPRDGRHRAYDPAHPTGATYRIVDQN